MYIYNVNEYTGFKIAIEDGFKEVSLILALSI